LDTERNNVLVYDLCGNYSMDTAMNEKVERMWADPRFQLLADLDRLLDSNKIWGGQEWVYHPIHPAKYRPMAERVRAELGRLYAEYEVEERK
jgi:hypothetical protein